jgi:hypothetical protein
MATNGGEKARLSIQPRSVRVLPGEPVRVELTVQAGSAAPIRLHVPADPRLLLRAVEKLPVQRAQEGAIVHRRVIVWQALEPGTIRMQAISLESRERKLLFPAITITISDPGS